MLLMVEEGIRGGICHAIHRNAISNNEYMNNYDKSIISAFLMYLHANNFYGWPMTQKLPINGFKWVEIFHERFIKAIMKTVIQDIFLNQMQSIQKNYFI